MNSGGRGGKSERGGGEAEVEWDHYLQPQLSLRLKTTLSSSPSSGLSTSLPHVQSMLLAVSLDPLFREPNRSREGGQQNLTLDLLDLASFSSSAIRAATPKDQLPLKAVYKDAVLGLRYLSLDGGEGTFKRLQVKFTSVEERERFVEAVRAFVPVKPAVESTTVKTSGKSKSSSKTTTSRETKQAALSLSSADFDTLLQEALLEQGFEELVARLQAMLSG
ncbi:hypothetical protein JCM8547_003909 [Rhodosporidiobolus lusitaniae]